jgi:hypothetical protein
LHRGAADDDDLERVAQPDGIRRDQGGELAERMPGHAHGIRKPLGAEHPVRGDVAGQERRLDELRRRQGGLVAAPGRDVSPERLRCFIEHRLTVGMADPGVGHPDPLRSLSREHDRVSHRAEPTVAPMCYRTGRVASPRTCPVE